MPGTAEDNAKEIFQEIDTDGSGSITLPELRERLTEKMAEEELSHLFNLMDVNHDGKVTWEEFTTAYSKTESLKGKLDLIMLRKKRELDGNRVKSTIEHAVEFHADKANAVLAEQAKPGSESVFDCIREHKHHFLKGCVFVGHLATDLDSIAGAYGAAALFGGKAARASELNTEIQHTLEVCGFEPPPKIEDVLAEKPDIKICLVDFQQTTQMHEAIQAKSENIVGVIDHHALQSKTLVVSKPMYIDVRPWGSMATIIAFNFLVERKPLAPNLAKLLLSAIVSDTLALKSPTSTDVDALIIAILTKLSGVEDINQYAKAQFKAKSQQVNELSTPELVVSDMKEFENGGVKFAFGVCETADAGALLARKDDIFNELHYIKKEKGVDVCFFALIDIVETSSKLWIMGPREKALAAAAFPDATYVSETEAPWDDLVLLDTKGRVSRKLDFAPVLGKLCDDGFELPAEIAFPINLPDTKLTMHETDSTIQRTPTASSE